MVCCRKWVLLTIVAFFSTSALLCEAKGQNVQQIALIDASTAGEQSVVVEQDVNIDGVAYETKKITKSDKAKNGIGDNAWVRAKKFFGKLFQKRSAAEVLAVEQEPIIDRAEKSFSKDIWKRAKQFIAELFQRKPVAETVAKEQEFAADSIDADDNAWVRAKKFFGKLFQKKSAAEVLAVEQEPIADRAEKSFSKDIWKRAKQFIAELFQRKPVAETAVKEQEFVVDSIEDKQFEVSPDEFDTSKSFKARLKRFLSRLFRKKHATESNAVEDDLIVNGKDEIIEASTPEADTGKSAWSKVKQFFARVFRKGSTEEMPIAAQKPIIDKIGNILGRDIWKRAKQFLVELSQRKPVAKAAAKNQKPIADSLENKPMEAGIISAESSKIAGFFDKIFSKKKTDKDVLDTLNLQHSVPIVNVASARLGQVQHVTNLIGSLRASNDVTIRSEVDGKITRILFEEGRKVNEGDLLIEVDDAGLRIHVREIQAQLMLAKAEYKRAKELARQEFLSKSELEKKRAEVLIMESKLGVSKEELSKFKIKAPFAGIVGLRELSVGEYVTKNKELLRIVSDQDVRVDFKVPEMLVAGMQIGQIIYIRIDGIHGEFPAEVLAINPEADQMSHSFTVRAVLQYQNEDMRPGLFVRVSVPSTSSSEAILVPESAVSHIGDNDIVFRVVDGMAMKTPVTIGVRQNGEVEILTGINADDIVITAGQLRVRDGSMVQISTDIDSLGHQ